MNQKTKYLLDVLIPAYQRTKGLLTAINSVVDQVNDYNLEHEVLITVRDDHSPGFRPEEFLNYFQNSRATVKINSNEENLGMSKNIYTMVESSTAEFCMVLTDDDWMQEKSLLELVCILRCLKDVVSMGGLYTPRYSYLENGDLNSIVCKRSDHPMVMGGNISEALKYCHDGFILTGLIFRKTSFSRDAWLSNIENAYFPVINFGFMLEKFKFLYLDRNWFSHTVLNVCFWDRWGATSSEQNKRLYRDYLDAIAAVSQGSTPIRSNYLLKLKQFYYEYENYSRQMDSQKKKIRQMDLWSLSSARAKSRLAFWLSTLRQLVLRFRSYLK